MKFVLFCPPRTIRIEVGEVFLAAWRETRELSEMRSDWRGIGVSLSISVRGVLRIGFFSSERRCCTERD